jgi:hypothetical protein
MKKARKSSGAEDQADEMLVEYAFDYEKARPNRFAPKIEEGSLIVILDPDIARVFKTPDSVKNVLRALIATMPEPPRD